jgi:hypothetical protein
MTQVLPARRAGGRGDQAVPAEPGARYGLLLLLLIATYLLAAFGLSTLAAEIQITLFLVVLLLALRTTMVSRRLARIAAVVALAGSAAAFAAALADTQTSDGAADLWKGLLLLVTAVLIVRRVLAKPTVTIQSIYGAISAYMIIGLMFAAFYGAIWHLGGGSFFAGQQTAQHQTNVPTIQYFSFTTLTTLGYGDFTAASDGGRAVAVVEALIGQVFLATLVARLVAAFRAPAGPAEPVQPAQPAQPARPARPGGGYRRRPPSAVRRGGGMSYRRRPARNASRTSPAAPVAPATAPERPG